MTMHWENGRQLCRSCWLWNHWHEKGKPCGIPECQCDYGQVAEPAEEETETKDATSC